MRTDDFNLVLENGDHVYNDKNGELVSISYDTLLLTEVELRRRKKQNYFADKMRNPAFDDYGTFLWLCFNPIENLFPDLNGTEVTMLIMLSTFIDYSNLLLTPNNKRMRQSDLVTLLQTSKATISRFVNKLKKNNIIDEKSNGDMYLNTKSFYRGEYRQRQARTTRVYIDTCRKLYYASEKGQRNKLSFIFRMIPWMDYRHNILVANPYEKDEDNVQPISLGDFAEFIGYGRNNASCLWKIISKIKIDGEPVVLAVMRNLNMRDATVMVNPKLLCGSRDVGTLRILFRDARKKGDEHNAYSNMIKSTKCN